MGYNEYCFLMVFECYSSVGIDWGFFFGKKRYIW